MSGGAFNYLCYKDPSELFDRREDLENMVAHLASIGAIDAARETETILLMLDHFTARVVARLNRLSGVWKAAEWKCSGDSGQEAVDDALAKYRGDVEPFTHDHEQTANQTGEK